MLECEDNNNSSSSVEEIKKKDQNQAADTSNVNNKTWNKPLKRTLTNAEIMSQSLLFFMAGYDTTSTTLEFIIYNLAKYPETQEILFNEIENVLDKHVYGCFLSLQK
jgi:cytochrome P450